MLKHSGATLVEMIVALTLTGLVFGSATVSFLRQQQTHRLARLTTGADAQLSAAMTIINTELSVLDREADLVASEARDTAIQFRAPIGFTVACTLGTGMLTLAHDTGASPLVALASPPKAGDSLWWRRDTTWSPALITAVGVASGPCAAPLTWLMKGASIALSVPDTIPVGTPVRITRQTRYSFYKASDGTWQLGFREASGIPSRFAPPQPVVGPVVLRSGSRHSTFRYFDTTGVELVAGLTGIPAGSISRIRITTFALVPGQMWWRDSLRVDSIDVALLHARGH
jgi:hypothetical protein